jgi:hypothetical protein
MPNVCMGNAAAGGDDDIATAACAIAEIHVPALALARFTSVAHPGLRFALPLWSPPGPKRKSAGATDAPGWH